MADITTKGIKFEGLNATLDGNITINGTANQQLILKDTTTGSGMLNWISFQDSAGTERAYLGYGSNSNSVVYLVNNLSDLKFYAGGVHNLTMAGSAATFEGDVTISGGDITLGGTGRIQGIDTVSASTDAANKTYVDTQITNLIGGAPGALDTLNELAAAINDDASYAAGITTALGLKAPLASPSFTGNATFAGTVEWSGGVGRLISNQLQSGYNQNSDNADFWINYQGYQGGTTYFRDFRVGDGKQNQIAVFDGSTKRIGIGVASPGAKLDVYDSQTTTGNIVVAQFIKNYVGGSSIFRTGLNAGSTTADIEMNSGGSGPFRYGSYGEMNIVNNRPTSKINFVNNSSIRMVIDSSGNVGIGTAAPGSILHIAGASPEVRIAATTDGQTARLGLYEDTAGFNHGGYIQYVGGGDTLRLGLVNGNVDIDVLTMTDAGAASFGGDLNIPRYLYHSGDTNTYMEFSAADNIKLVAAGKTYLHAHDNGNLYLYGNNGTALTLDGSQHATFENSLYIPNYIYHSGDTNTYIYFDTDHIYLRAGGNDRIQIRPNDLMLDQSTQYRSFHIPQANNGNGRWDVLEFGYDTANWHASAIEVTVTRQGYGRPKYTKWIIGNGHGENLNYRVVSGGDIIGYWNDSGTYSTGGTQVSGNIYKSSFSFQYENYYSYHVEMKVGKNVSSVGSITAGNQVKFNSESTSYHSTTNNYTAHASATGEITEANQRISGHLTVSGQLKLATGTTYLIQSGNGLQIKTGDSSQYTSEFHQGGNFYTAKIIDINNTSYYMDPASGTSLGGNLTVAGTIYASNDAYAYSFASDTATGMARTGTHQIAFKHNGNTSLTLAADLSAAFGGNVHAPIILDSNDTGYYVNPNSTSKIRRTDIVASGSGWDDHLNLYSSDGSNRWNLLCDNGAADQFRIAYNNTERINITTSGAVTCLVDIRSPIFYDRDNTNYYANLAATSDNSTAVSLKVRQTVVIGDSSTYNVNDGGWGARLVVSDNVHARIDVAQDANSMKSSWYSHTGHGGSYFGTVTAHHQYLTSHNAVRQTLFSGYSQEGGSYRAPIFYDSDNTGYYLNPASTSNLNDVEIVQLAIDGYIYHKGDTNTYIGFSAADTFVARTSGVDRLLIDSSGNVTSVLNIKSPIFYDTNNTNYYCDPASTSVMYAATFAGTVTATKAGTVGIFNSGATNVVASFTSTDGTAAIQLVDNSGNVELSAAGNTFQVQPAGGTAALSVSATAATFTDGATYHKIQTYYSGSYTSGFKFSDYNGGIWYDAGNDDLILNGGHANSQIIFNSGNALALTLNSSQAATFAGQVTVANGSSTSTYGFRHEGSGKYMRMGMPNASYAYFETDANAGFYIDGQVSVNGPVRAANGSVGAPGITFKDDTDVGIYRNTTNQMTLTAAGTAVVTVHSAGIQMNNKDIDYVNQLHFNDNVRFYDDGNDSYINFKFGDTTAGGIKFYDGSGNLHGYFYADGDDSIGILDSGGSWAVQVDNDVITALKVQDSYRVKATTSGVEMSNIYDIGNTGYYLNPNSTSILWEIKDDHGNEYINKYHSASDFADGTLIVTDIVSNTTNGDSFVLEATGKSYSANPPFSFMAQGYLYNSTIINYSGIHNGYAGFTTMKVFDHSGVLAFWWPRVSYWNSFEVRVRNANGANTARNRVTGISNSTEPSSSKKVTITMATPVLYGHSTNAGNVYATAFYDSASTGYYCNPAGTSNLADVAVTALTMNDNSKAKFGNGNDLEIYHDGTNTNIENDTGYLMIRSDTAIHLRSTTGNEPYISCTHNGGVVLYYNDAIKFQTTNTGAQVTGAFTASGDVIAYSDRKLKKNIKTLDGSKVYDMRGVSFTRKDTGKDGSGIIAQELQKIAPELVSETNGTLGVAYGNITGYLIEAIKELKAEVEELKNHKCDGCTK